MDVCRRVRTQLARVRRLRFTATPSHGSRTGWAGSGQADVEVRRDADGLRLYENGCFQPRGRTATLAFRNVYRWSGDGDRLSLWHERFGRDAPVWLFDLAAADARTLTSVSAHVCGADRYRARLTLQDDGFDLHWVIVGPSKNETLHYAYRG